VVGKVAQLIEEQRNNSFLLLLEVTSTNTTKSDVSPKVSGGGEVGVGVCVSP